MSGHRPFAHLRDALDANPESAQRLVLLIEELDGLLSLLTESADTENDGGRHRRHE